MESAGLESGPRDATLMKERVSRTSGAAPAVNTEAEGGAGGDHERKKRKVAGGMVITVNVRDAYEEARIQAKELRVQLMASWKENASLRRARDGLLDKLRSCNRKSERTEFVASQAVKWQRDAEDAARAQVDLKGAMVSYRTATARLQEETKTRKE
eukprot:6130294-Pleurochrysis_carterae.AAC.1